MLKKKITNCEVTQLNIPVSGHTCNSKWYNLLYHSPHSFPPQNRRFPALDAESLRCSYYQQRHTLSPLLKSASLFIHKLLASLFSQTRSELYMFTRWRDCHADYGSEALFHEEMTCLQLVHEAHVGVDAEPPLLDVAECIPTQRTIR